jgi:hypothetical protein
VTTTEIDRTSHSYQLGAAERRITTMLELIRMIDAADAKFNVFDCPSGGAIRQDIKRILSDGA